MKLLEDRKRRGGKNEFYRNFFFQNQVEENEVILSYGGQYDVPRNIRSDHISTPLEPSGMRQSSIFQPFSPRHKIAFKVCFAISAAPSLSAGATLYPNRICSSPSIISRKFYMNYPRLVESNGAGKVCSLIK